MDELITHALNALTSASGSITGFAGTLRDEQWDVYADTTDRLVVSLQQLDQYANVKYAFDEGIPGDIINYTQQLNLYEQPITEVIGFQLSHLQFMEGNSWDGQRALYLQETLHAIIYEAETISSILAGARQ